MNIEVLEDKAAVAERAAVLLAGVQAGAHVALSGGSTPKSAYALAAEKRSDWSGVTLWLGDERVVPGEDERSNALMVREQLLTRIPRGTLPRFEPVETSLSPESAADDYDRRLHSAVSRFDLCLMGLGPDSHTASLFPGKPALDITGRWAVAVPEAGMEPYVPRVTLTFEVFNNARDVVFLVAGEDKADAMVRAFGEPPDPDAPSGRVRPTGGNLLVLADRAAAAHLR
jgi:6-phosphogluconolactonase